MCFASAFALMPLAARSAASARAPLSRLPSLDTLRAQPLAIVTPRRDPFADSRIDALPRAAELTPSVPPMPLGPLPGNLNGSVIPLVPGAPAFNDTGPVITAIVTGAHAFALIESGGISLVKGIGESIDGSPIVAITIDNVTLRDGRKLRLSAANERPARAVVPLPSRNAPRQTALPPAAALPIMLPAPEGSSS